MKKGMVKSGAGNVKSRGRTGGPGCGRVLWGVLLGCFLLAGCGGPDREAGLGQTVETKMSGNGEAGDGRKTETGKETTENKSSMGQTGTGGGYYDIRTETEELFEADDAAELICMQYYQGEPVQVRCSRKEDQKGETVGNVYLYREDGSRELLFEKFPDMRNEMGTGTGVLAQDGSFYYIKNETLMKWDLRGSRAYEKNLGLNLKDICQLADGTIVLLAQDGSDVLSRTVLMKLDKDAGTVSSIGNVMLSNGGLTGVYMGIAAGGEGLLLMERTEGIYEIDLEKGSKTNILSFRNATIELVTQSNDRDKILHDFRMLENGKTEILWAKKGAGVCETLCREETDKTVLLIRGYIIYDQWLKEQIMEFNRSNQVYQVMLETAGEGVEEEDYARQTSIELGAGRGPDILYSGVLGDYAQGVIMQGGFENLRPYIEKGGLEEEKYFPITFCSYGMGDGVYGISTDIEATGWMIKGEILGGRETPDIQTLVEALFEWPEEGSFEANRDGEEILRFFLEGSESLWGMVDWERGNCDFSKDLFLKMLEVAKRYAYQEGTNRPVVAWTTVPSNFRTFCASKVQKQMGGVEVGTLFDDGCHAKKMLWDNSFAVNVNSPHKQGAWEFIRFLLEDKAQMALAAQRCTPVYRTAFDKALQIRLGDITAEKTVEVGAYILSNGKVSKGDNWVTFRREDVTEEWMEEYRKAMEEVRCLPLRTQAILEIICQEAEDYFRGVRSGEQVVETISNRVQLYLDENL